MDNTDIQSARVVALRFLGHSARTKLEIERRLQDEFPPEIIAEVMDELATAGYLDDVEFARHWIEDRADRKRYGRNRLASELNRKGIDRETADEALDKIDEEDEARRAKLALDGRWSNDKMRGLGPLELQKELQRLSGFLARRGFAWQTIRKVLDEAVTNNH